MENEEPKNGKNIILITDDVDEDLNEFNKSIIKEFNLQECCSFGLKYYDDDNNEDTRKMEIYSTEKKSNIGNVGVIIFSCYVDSYFVNLDFVKGINGFENNISVNIGEEENPGGTIQFAADVNYEELDESVDTIKSVMQNGKSTSVSLESLKLLAGYGGIQENEDGKNEDSSDSEFETALDENDFLRLEKEKEKEKNEDINKNIFDQENIKEIEKDVKEYEKENEKENELEKELEKGFNPNEKVETSNNTPFDINEEEIKKIDDNDCNDDDDNELKSLIENGNEKENEENKNFKELNEELIKKIEAKKAIIVLINTYDDKRVTEKLKLKKCATLKSTVKYVNDYFIYADSKYQDKNEISDVDVIIFCSFLKDEYLNNKPLSDIFSTIKKQKFENTVQFYNYNEKFKFKCKQYVGSKIKDKDQGLNKLYNIIIKMIDNNSKVTIPLPTKEIDEVNINKDEDIINHEKYNKDEKNEEVIQKVGEKKDENIKEENEKKKEKEKEENQEKKNENEKENEEKKEKEDKNIVIIQEKKNDEKDDKNEKIEENQEKKNEKGSNLEQLNINKDKIINENKDKMLDENKDAAKNLGDILKQKSTKQLVNEFLDSVNKGTKEEVKGTIDQFYDCVNLISQFLGITSSKVTKRSEYLSELQEKFKNNAKKIANKFPVWSFALAEGLKNSSFYGRLCGDENENEDSGITIASKQKRSNIIKRFGKRFVNFFTGKPGKHKTIDQVNSVLKKYSEPWAIAWVLSRENGEKISENSMIAELDKICAEKDDKKFESALNAFLKNVGAKVKANLDVGATLDNVFGNASGSSKIKKRVKSIYKRLYKIHENDEDYAVAGGNDDIINELNDEKNKGFFSGFFGLFSQKKKINKKIHKRYVDFKEELGLFD